MSIFRVEKTNDYTVMSNHHLREKNMSLKAKGLLSWMLSNDDGWDYSIAGIVANCKENETAIKTTLGELKQFGYLEIIKKNPDEQVSVIHYEYVIHEQPVHSQGVESQGVENQPLEDLEVENPGERNKKEISKNIINKKEISKNKNTDFLHQPKLNLYTKCINLIDSFATDVAINTLLVTFLDSLSEMGKLKGYTQFQGILKKLQGHTKEEQIKMIDYSIQHGYGTFYELNNDYKPTSNRKHGSSDYSFKTGYTEQERRQIKERACNNGEKF